MERLRQIYTEALIQPEVAALSIATRPDCLGREVLNLIEELNQIKPIWVELGLQTIHEQSAAYIRRGYPLSCFEDSLAQLNERRIETIVHTILGLPGESFDDMEQTARYLAGKNIQGIKPQLLHVLKNTDLAIDYEKNHFHILTLEEYANILIRCIEVLPPQVVVHRVTGDGPKSLLLEPVWSGHKKFVLNEIHRQFKLRGAYQGKRVR